MPTQAKQLFESILITSIGIKFNTAHRTPTDIHTHFNGQIGSQLRMQRVTIAKKMRIGTIAAIETGENAKRSAASRRGRLRLAEQSDLKALPTEEISD